MYCSKFVTLVDASGFIKFKRRETQCIMLDMLVMCSRHSEQVYC